MGDRGALDSRAKRVLDIVGASVALLLLTPAITWIALVLVAAQGLPILFRQQRPGLNGQPFTILKFRTMRSPRNGEVWYLTDDERTTRLGRFLRATSLDELPEFWNVIRGEMSLVGPRPLLMEYLTQYTPEQRRRMAVRPGVTGWAVVNGRNLLRFEDRLALDVWYVDHWSLRLDLQILLMTVAQVVRREGATATEDLSLGFPLPGAAQPPMASADDGRREGVVSVDGPSPAVRKRSESLGESQVLAIVDGDLHE